MALIRPKKSQLTAAMLTDHKLISLGLPDISGTDLMILEDVYYGRNGIVQLLSSKKEWDILFLGIGYQKMSDMRMVTKVISQKTTTSVVIVAPTFNQDEERIYRKDGAKYYIMECSEMSNNCESINSLIQEIHERKIMLSEREHRLTESLSHSQIVDLFEALSPCEKTVIKLYLRGLSLTEIASLNKKSIKTVSGQKKSAMKKLGIANSMEIFRCLGRYVSR